MPPWGRPAGIHRGLLRQLPLRSRLAGSAERAPDPSLDAFHPGSSTPRPLRQGTGLRPEQAAKDLPFIDRGALGAALMPVDQLGVVHTQGMKDRGVEVVDVESVFDGVQADLVGLADDEA